MCNKTLGRNAPTYAHIWAYVGASAMVACSESKECSGLFLQRQGLFKTEHLHVSLWIHHALLGLQKWVQTDNKPCWITPESADTKKGEISPK